MLRVLAVVAAALLVGCGSSRAKPDPDPGPKVKAPHGLTPASRLGAPEGKLALLAPDGYVPAAATRVPGCDVTVTSVSTSDQVVRKLSTGRYDGALGNGDAFVRLAAAGAIAPVNTKLVPNYEDVYDGLKLQPFNSIAGQAFAVPVGRAARLMVWRRNAIPGTLTSLGALLDPPQVASLGEQAVVPDDPASIAEAALWVARQRKDLAITDPYELDRHQFRAVLRILRLQHPYVSEYWHDPGAVRDAFRAGRASIGMAPQSIVGALERGPGDLGPIGSIRPREGSTGISPAWMVSAKAAHPNCMYRFLDRALDPAVNAQTALDAAVAPANSKACDVLEQRGNESFCDLYHADDDGYYAKVLFRTYPERDCGDARGRVCMGWPTWVRAWKRVMAA
jgi:putative spermidine/putrescine transport system substrate-binding protein